MSYVLSPTHELGGICRSSHVVAIEPGSNSRSYFAVPIPLLQRRSFFQTEGCAGLPGMIFTARLAVPCLYIMSIS